MFWKINIKDKYQAKLFFVFYLISHLADLLTKKLFQNFGRWYLGQIWEMDVMEVTQGGSDTHDDQYETGAAWTATRPFLVHFRKYQKFLNFWLL